MKRTCWLAVGGFVFVLISGLGGTGVVAQNLTLQAGLSYYPNPALDSVVLIEFPFTLNRNDFVFYQPDSTDSHFYARVYAEVKLIGSDGLPLDSVKTFFSVQATSLEDAERPGLKIFDKLSLLVRPGLYSARLTVIDVVSKREGIAFYDVVKSDLPVADYLTLSSVTLAYSIENADAASSNPRLVRNGLVIHTNPLGVYSTSDSLVLFYTELYNLSGVGEAAAPLRVSYRLEDEQGQTRRDFGFLFQSRIASSLILTETLDIKGVSAGIYYLRLEVTDTVFKQTTVQRSQLLIIHPETYTAEAVKHRRANDPYDTLEAQTKVNLVHYMLNPDQRSVLNSLSDQGKLNYLDQFWLDRDENPATEIVENRLEIIQRYNYANDVFSRDVVDGKGWASDRGRIYITHGEPGNTSSQVMPTLDSPNSSTFRVSDPYEVWYYPNLGGGEEVVFVVTGLESYRLVHSTFDGDIYSTYWYSILRSSEVDSDF